ncbi:hypothetical protein [Streptomyces zaomyceticus]|uniref:hypothetical protein n=1 Tax=Streptomyces zaomyceticus TaxID=68286 RepID=UPI002E1B2CAC
MTTRKNPPAANQGAEDQRTSGSATTVARRSHIAYCRAYTARGAFGRFWVLVVLDCPFCGKQHSHGGGDQLRPSYGHRAAHCANSRPGHGYWLEPAEVTS